MEKNKKNNYKLLIALSSLCIAFASLGTTTLIKEASASSEPTVTSLKMIEGASVRSGTQKEAEDAGLTNTDGIRFSAEISIEEYEALSNFGIVSAGTFIMPETYLEYAGINEKSCFTGATQSYTWEGKVPIEGTEDGTVKILHVASKPYKVESEITDGTEIYRINGSVVQMENVNLDRKYIGISYLLVDGESKDYYFFAPTVREYSRSIVTVSQNALIKNTDADDVAIANKYLTDYLELKGGEIKTTVTQEVYVNSSEGYSKSAVKSKTIDVTMTESSHFTATYGGIPTMDGYLYVKAKETQTSSVARVNENVELKYYFDKKIDSALILDSSESTGGTDIFAANGATKYGSTFKSNAQWSYHGDNSIMYNDYAGDNWNFEFGTAKILPAATNQISFMIKNHHTQVHNGDHRNKIIVFMEDGTRATGYWTPSSTPNDVYKVTVTLDKEITNVKKVVFNADDKANGYEENPMWIDFIQAEYGLLANGVSNIELKAGEKELELDIVDKMVSTKLSDEQIIDGLIVTAKELPNGTATTIMPTEGKYKLTITEGTNYEIEYSVSVGELTASGKFFVLGYISGWLESFEASELPQSGTRTTVVSTHSIDGSKALQARYNSSNTDTYTYTTSISNDETFTTICFWAYVDDDFSTTSTLLAVNIGSATAYVQNITLKAGWNYIEMNERGNKNMSGEIKGFTFAAWNLPSTGIIVDRISLK